MSEAKYEDRAKRDPSYVYFPIFLKRREGGPKGRPCEASLNFFGECGLILVKVWSDQIVKIRKIIVWSHATYGRKCEAKEASDGRKNNAGAELLGR